MVDENETPKPKEPENALEENFKDMYLNLPVLEVLAHAPIYNAILDKYVGSLELRKNRLADSKPFDTLADLGSCVNLIPLSLFKKIDLLEETENVIGLVDETKAYSIGIVRVVDVYVGRLKLLEDFYFLDMELDPTFLLLVGR
ncbi:DNA damage-inducible protein 1-like protein [Tanacetum coccineum]